MHVSSRISLSPYLLISLSPYLLISLSPYLLISLSPYLIISLSPYPMIRSWIASLTSKPAFLTFQPHFNGIERHFNGCTGAAPRWEGASEKPASTTRPAPSPALSPYLLISSLPPRQFMHPTTANKRRPGATIEWIADRIASGSSRDPSIHPSPPACIPEAFRKFRVPRSNGFLSSDGRPALPAPYLLISLSPRRPALPAHGMPPMPSSMIPLR